MPYILYTLAPNRAKYLTPDPDPLLGIWARNGAKAHSLVNLKVQSSQPTLISRRRGARVLCAYPLLQ